MKLPRQFSSLFKNLITNKYVLYLVAFLALTNVLGYMMLGQLQCVILFILIGYIATHFSKNMVIVLLAPLIVVNFLASCVVAGKIMKEGFTEGNTPGEVSTTTTTTTEEKESVKEPEPAPASCPDGQKLNEDGKCESFETGRAKNGAVGGAPRIDQATTMENAYDNLDSLLGSDGSKNLTADTHKLMNQQKQLAEAMKGMGPLLQQAQGMMKSMNLDGLGDVPSLMKKMGMNSGESVKEGINSKTSNTK